MRSDLAYFSLAIFSNKYRARSLCRIYRLYFPLQFQPIGRNCFLPRVRASNTDINWRLASCKWSRAERGYPPKACPPKPRGRIPSGSHAVPYAPGTPGTGRGADSSNRHAVKPGQARAGHAGLAPRRVSPGPLGGPTAFFQSRPAPPGPVWPLKKDDASFLPGAL